MQKALEATFLIFDYLLWNTPLPYLRRNVTTTDLTPFLGTSWLNDDHINMMVEDINNWVNANEHLQGKILVAPLIFAANLQQVNKGLQGSKYLDWMIQMVTSLSLERIYFLVNINQNHWITAYIDFVKHSFGYGKTISLSFRLTHKVTGDSLLSLYDSPTRLMTGLTCWLHKSSREKFICEGDSLCHGHQKDTYCSFPTTSSLYNQLHNVSQMYQHWTFWMDMDMH